MNEGRKDSVDGVIVGIPAYNEEKTIASVVMKSLDHVDEVVVVDDGSEDDTSRLAEKAGAHVIDHEKNLGKGEAMKTLFQYSRQKGVRAMVTLDGDGQHPEGEITNLLDRVLKGEADIAIASRFLSRKHKKKVPAYRRFGNKVLSLLTPSGKAKNDEKNPLSKVKDTQCGFRAYSGKAVEKITPRERGIGVDSEILIQGKKKGLDIIEIPATVSYEGDTSHKGPVKHTLSVIGSIIRYIETKHALLTFGVPGLIAFILGILMGFRVLSRFQEYGHFPVGTGILTLLLLIGGMGAGMTGLILHAIINAHRRDYR